MKSRVAVQSITHDPYYDPNALSMTSFHNATFAALGQKQARPLPVHVTSTGMPQNVRLQAAVTSLTRAQQVEEQQTRNAILRSSLVLGFIVLAFSFMLAAVDTSVAVAATASAQAAEGSGVLSVVVWLVLAVAVLAFHFSLRSSRR